MKCIKVKPLHACLIFLALLITMPATGMYKAIIAQFDEDIHKRIDIMELSDNLLNLYQGYISAATKNDQKDQFIELEFNISNALRTINSIAAQTRSAWRLPPETKPLFKSPNKSVVSFQASSKQIPRFSQNENEQYTAYVKECKENSLIPQTKSVWEFIFEPEQPEPSTQNLSQNISTTITRPAIQPGLTQEVKNSLLDQELVPGSDMYQSLTRKNTKEAGKFEHNINRVLNELVDNLIKKDDASMYSLRRYTISVLKDYIDTISNVQKYVSSQGYASPDTYYKTLKKLIEQIILDKKNLTSHQLTEYEKEQLLNETILESTINKNVSSERKSWIIHFNDMSKDIAKAGIYDPNNYPKRNSYTDKINDIQIFAHFPRKYKMLKKIINGAG